MRTYLNNIWTIIQTSVCLQGLVYCIHEAVFHKEKGKYLANSVIRTEHAESEFDCSAFCTRENSCVSVNYKTSGQNQGLCELNSKSLSDAKDNQKEMAEFSNLEIVKRSCEEPFQTFSPGTKKCVALKSCKELMANNPTLENGHYFLQSNISAPKYSVYCHMSEIQGCGEGGWTLVLKVNGNKSTFGYDSSYWTNTRKYNERDGVDGLTDRESKLESYWSTPFTKICVGMKVKNEIKWITLDHQAISFHSVITDANFRATNVGRNTWKSLITGSSLQEFCNKEGFNFRYFYDNKMYIKMRLGIAANNQNDCQTCDSWLGFGVSFETCFKTSYVTSGNFAICGGNDNGHKETGAVGYILVQ